MSADLRLAVGLLALLAVTTAWLTVSGVGLRRSVLTAAARAAVQLAAVGLVIRAVFAAPVGSVAVLAVMLGVATRTSARRLAAFPRAGRAVLLSSVVGAGVTLAVVFSVPMVPRTGRYLIALGGITLGGTMTACTLAGRRLADALDRSRDVVEGWLALGATPRQAVADLARTSAGEALLPATDQTRTVGLVTLPGAFVGALLGGASPTTAARFQLVVLIALLAAETLAATTLTWLLGAPRQLPAQTWSRIAKPPGTDSAR